MRRTVTARATAKGQKVFIGSDVHKKSLSVSCV
jgi:hypothetical protein